MVKELHTIFNLDELTIDIAECLRGRFPSLDDSTSLGMAQTAWNGMVQEGESSLVYQALVELGSKYASRVYESSLEGDSPVSLDEPSHRQVSCYDAYFSGGTGSDNIGENLD